MRYRLCVMTLVATLVAGPAHAQFIPFPIFGPLPVIDASNLTQAVLIAQRMQQHYEELRAQYLTIQRMARRLGSLDGYRIPATPIAYHDAARWTYGQPWIQALNSGDATGAAYLSTVLPLLRPDVVPNQLTPAARLALERHYATIEIADSVAAMGGHQVALARGYHGALQQAVEALEADVIGGPAGSHEMTAILDKIAAGELLARRQDMLANQLLSHAVEQLLARGKRLRDAEATAMNMQLVTWRDARAANDAFVAGTGDALSTWRQP